MRTEEKTKEQIQKILGKKIWSKSCQEYYANVLCAAQEFLNRKLRISHPAGEFDKARRFYLSEKCECCKGIREPSRSYPFSQNVHGRTAKHVANLFGVDAALVKREAARIEKQSN